MFKAWLLQQTRWRIADQFRRRNKAAQAHGRLRSTPPEPLSEATAMATVDRIPDPAGQFEPVSRTHERLMDILHLGCHEESGDLYYVMELADNAEVRDQNSRVSDASKQSALTSDL